MDVPVFYNTIPDAQVFVELSSGCANLGCRRFIDDVMLENAQLRSALTRALAENRSLKETLEQSQRLAQELYEKANLGSDTSGIPGSKDWKNNGTAKILENHEAPESTGEDAPAQDKETPISVSGYINGNGGGKKQRGGQPKHPPNFMRFNADVRKTNQIDCYPDKCTNCPRLGQCVEEGNVRQYTTAYGYDIEVVLVKNEYQQFEATECPLDGSQIREEFPMVIGSQFYDLNIQLHILTWHHLFHGSYERISQAAKELFGLSLGAGTALAIYQRASAKILGSGFMDALRFYALLFVTVLGFDETSARVAGRNAWVHTAVSDGITLLTAHWRRGYEGAIYSGLIQFYINTIISDCWAAYFNGDIKATHALCCAHILRELVAAAFFRGQKWAIDMFDLLLELFEEKRDAVEGGEKGFPQEYLDEIRGRYRQIVSDGYIEIDGETKGKSFSLLERLKNLEGSVLAFAVDFDVKFTNNFSEISLRDLKVALSVIGQFKTMAGLADYCIVQSFMDTCRKQGHNPFDMMKVVLSGGDVIVAIFGAEKAGPIKQMIRLADAVASGDDNAIDAAKTAITFELTDNLLAAASFSRYRVCDDPPPEKKDSPTAVPKDKMAAARERNIVKKPAQSTPCDEQMQIGTADTPEKKRQRARAAPKSA